MNRRTLLSLLALFVAACALDGCSKRTDPERQIRELLQTAEASIEKKDIGPVREYVSDRYTDEDGRDRRAIDGLLRLYVLRNENIHLFTRIVDIGFPDKQRARVALYVAMAAQPIAHAEDLTRVQADLYRFELDFVEESKSWHVISARWRPALPTDFIF
ncbi:MAG: hypothetical protein ACJ8KO_01015 [Sulfurifustaceae bacterium]